MNTYKINNGVNLHIINTKKYKDLSIFINFYCATDKKERICRALLTNIIGNKSKKYSSKQAITNKKDYLFGTSLNLSNITVGEGHIFQVYSKILNEKFTLEQTNNEFLDFINEIIQNPIIDENILNEAKTVLKSRCLRKIDSPTSYSMSRVFQIYGKDTFIENLSISNIDDIDKITLDDVINAFNSMIKNDYIDIYVLGDLDETKIYDYFKKLDYLSNERKSINKNIMEVNPDLNEYYYEEEKNITQSSLILTYKTNILKRSDEFFSLRVANALLGLVPGSMLFQEVREKNSLCYSINSSILGEEGMLVIKTLIDSNNSEKTIELIKKQVNKIKNGEFEMSTVKECLSLYINMLNGISDDIVQTVSMLYAANIDNRVCNLEEDIKLMNSVTKEQIISAFNKLELKLVYLLKEVK